MNQNSEHIIFVDDSQDKADVFPSAVLPVEIITGTLLVANVQKPASENAFSLTTLNLFRKRQNLFLLILCPELQCTAFF